MTRPNKNALRNISANRRGVTIVEFAITAPVLMLMLMGLGDVLYQVYAQSLLDGAIQKAGRDSAIEGGADKIEDLDKIVKDSVKSIARRAEFESTRVSYSGFSNAKPEKFTDSNGNGRYNKPECFDDVNGNSVWNADPGITGQGKASDVTRYTMTVTYPRIFPMAGLLGLPSENTIKASTFLKNQPFASQQITAVKTICT